MNTARAWDKTEDPFVAANEERRHIILEETTETVTAEEARRLFQPEQTLTPEQYEQWKRETSVHEFSLLHDSKMEIFMNKECIDMFGGMTSGEEPQDFVTRLFGNENEVDEGVLGLTEEHFLNRMRYSSWWIHEGRLHAGAANARRIIPKELEGNKRYAEAIEEARNAKRWCEISMYRPVKDERIEDVDTVMES